MTVLITGGTGFLGSHLARELDKAGERVVLFDANPNYRNIEDIQEGVKVAKGNLANWPEVLDAVKKYDVSGIYHLGSLLSMPSEDNHWSSFQVNVCGTMHVLEAARLFGVGKIIFSSSLATYSLGLTKVVDDDSLQRPTLMYGCGKLYCEHLGRFYRSKYGLDFRSFRSPTLVGPGVSTPGITQFASLMIESAAYGRPYKCYVTPDSKSAGFMYYKDAVRALIMLYRAPQDQIQTVNYNVSALPGGITAGDIESSIRKTIPAFSLTYEPDKQTVDYLHKKYRDGTMSVIDDSRARQEWGWKPLYTDLDTLVVDFVKECQMQNVKG